MHQHYRNRTLGPKSGRGFFNVRVNLRRVCRRTGAVISVLVWQDKNRGRRAASYYFVALYDTRNQDAGFDSL